jgi:uncharacterized membrane protein YfcA
MLDPNLLIVMAIFALAGIVKGVIGLGLPTISMGLLAVVMPPVQAAALLLAPSFITNVWQMLTGPSLAGAVRRLWPMMLAIALGTWAGAGLMTGAASRFGSAFLGAALAAYALVGLASVRLWAPKRWEGILSPAIGAMTGLISAATGVFVIPLVPYLQAIDLDKDRLVQALGLAFTVSTIALAVNIGLEGGLRPSLARPIAVAIAASCIGMWAGQWVRTRLSPSAFRIWFFAGLLLLGLYLAARSAL